jgi:hypothetical protein
MADNVATGRPIHERSIFLAAACAVLVTLPYISALTHVFDYHDSFYVFSHKHHLSCDRHPQFYSFFLIGRPLYAYLNCYFGTLITSLHDAILVRAIGLMVVISCAIWIIRVLRDVGTPGIVAMVAACALIWLPGFQLFIAMSQAAPILFTLPLGILSFVELRAGCAAINRRHTWPASHHFVFSILSLLLATQIYQHMTSLIFCFVFAAVWPMGPKSRQSGRQLIAGSIGVFGAQGILYLLVYHAIIAPFFTQLSGLTLAEASASDHARDIAISTNISAKLDLLYALTPNTFALWLAGPPVAFYGAVIGLAVASVVAVFILDVGNGRYQADSPSWAFAAEKLAWLVVLALLVNAPNLIAKNYTLALRGEVPYQWLIVLLLLLTGWRLANALGGTVAHRVAGTALASFTTIGLCTASWNLYRNLVLVNAGEFRFIQQELRDYIPTKAAPACVISPGLSNVGAMSHPETQTDEFGKLTTMFPQDVPWIISAAVADYTGELNGYAIVLDPKESPAKFHCGVVIDMRRYASQLAQLRATDALFPQMIGTKNELFADDFKFPVGSRHHRFEVTGGDPGTGLRNAFSVEPDGSFEADISSPVTVDISYSWPALIDHYGFESDEAGERMPQSWSFLASNDGKTWVKLDARSLQDPWPPNQRKLFHFENHQSFFKFRFVFEQAFDPEFLRIYKILF